MPVNVREAKSRLLAGLGDPDARVTDDGPAGVGDSVNQSHSLPRLEMRFRVRGCPAQKKFDVNKFAKHPWKMKGSLFFEPGAAHHPRQQRQRLRKTVGLARNWPGQRILQLIGGGDGYGAHAIGHRWSRGTFV